MPEAGVPENIDNCLRFCPASVAGARVVIKHCIASRCEGPNVVERTVIKDERKSSLRHVTTECGSPENSFINSGGFYADLEEGISILDSEEIDSRVLSQEELRVLPIDLKKWLQRGESF